MNKLPKCYGIVPARCTICPREKLTSKIEAPRSKLRGIFDRKEVCHFQIRSLTPQQAAGNALAFAVQLMEMETFKKLLDDCICDKLNYILI